ncbi:MAG: N-acetylmuramoyl-L-alanine amidase [Lamprobacter sp.]|uniref:peptidoglycan recognition protein family protein n=1 Tax=Lamprobacter sp. TaxID=3100796 RepID=UPI002B25A57A|nr:N-acetylmuramoyl-L-alanine amidase [Lamprobacter sp.]MEA3640498.1 N-acetylmuramoyl-L-alanine amidase [Lamprobacter sp.]
MGNKSYALVSKMRDPSVRMALANALKDDGRLSYDEILMIVASTYDWGIVTWHEFNDLKTILNEAKTIDQRSKNYINNFLNKLYHDYLANQSKKKAFTLPYTKDHIPKTTNNSRRPGYAMTPQYLTIHSTANPKSYATGERKWLTNPTNNRTASFHLVVDEKEAIECLPLNEVAWHAGDGGKGTGNRKSIGMEICESGDRQKTLENAISLAAKILKDHSWDTTKLKRHYDWTQKICPRILIDSGQRDKQTQTWEWFTKQVATLL